MRTKENSKDYRFFPEPDLPVFIPDAAFRAEVEAGLVELPLPRSKRIAADYALGIERAALICEEREVADYYEAAVAAACGLGMERADAAERVANRLLSDVKHILSRDSIDTSAIGSIRLTAARLAELTFLVASGKLSNKNAKQTLEAVFAEDKGPAAIVAERGWEQISDPAAIAEAVGKVWEAEAATVSDAASALAGGNQKKLKALTAYLVGKTLAVTGGRASPDIAGQLVNEQLAMAPVPFSIASGERTRLTDGEKAVVSDR
jgi:aspartyl-tRNA(Asn)/glutamyl-tRNA(Gln) amidotransferase subunit B